MYWLYSIILALGLILSSPYWLVKGIRERKYLHNFLQRLSLRLPTPTNSSKPLWIHAVSVGEVLAAKPLFSAIRAVRPEMPVITMMVMRIMPTNATTLTTSAHFKILFMVSTAIEFVTLWFYQALQ